MDNFSKKAFRHLTPKWAKKRETGHPSSERSQAAAPASSSSPTATANHDASSMPGTETVDSNEPANHFTTGVGDENVHDHPEQIAPSGPSPVDSPIINESQKLTLRSQSPNQLEAQDAQITPDSPTFEPISIPTPNLTPEKHADWLWNAAYDQIMAENPKTLYEYELIVESYITMGRRPSLIPRRSSISSELGSTVQVDHQARKTLMDNCLDAWLREALPRVVESTTSDDDDDDESITSDEDESRVGDGTMDYATNGKPEEAREADGYEKVDAHSLKTKLREGVQGSQHASLAWVATCLAVDIWLDPSVLPRTAQLEAIPIFTKMQWYIGLSKLLRPGDHNETEEYLNGNQLNTESLVGLVVQLYKAVLWYQISIVCRHWGSVERSSRQPEQLVGESEFNEYERNIRTKEEELAGFDGRKLQVELRQILKKCRKPDQEDVATTEPMTPLERLLSKLNVVELPIIKTQARPQSAPKLLYNWLCSTQQYGRFLAWDTEPNERVLWIHGGPGAGKTMLLQMAVQELRKDSTSSSSDKHGRVAYFFCDSSRPSQATALSVVKSLIYHILKSQESQGSLSKHLKRKFDMTNRENFDEKNDFYTISTVLYALLREEDFQQTYFIIDAIEELVPDKDIDSDNRPASDNGREPSGLLDEVGLDDLFNLISTTAADSDKIRWLVSLDSDRCSARLAPTRKNTHLHLTVHPDLQPVREATYSYAVSKINEIADRQRYNSTLRNQMIQKTEENPNSFLWLNMALDIIKASTTPWNAPTIMEQLKASAPDINHMYLNRLEEMERLGKVDKDYCTHTLSAVAMAYRPLLETELEAILSFPSEVSSSLLVEGILSPFLQFYKDEQSNGRRISFVHLSAKDFIRRELRLQGLGMEHSKMAIRCLKILQQAVTSSSSALPLEYAAIFWIRHLSEAHDDDGQAITEAKDFLNKYSVEWLQVLDSLDLLLQASVMIAELDLTLKVCPDHEASNADIVHTEDFHPIIRDVRTLMNVHRTSTRYGDSLVGPKNSLLFWRSRTSLRQRLLKKHFPWLDAAPIIDLSSATSDASLHSIYHPDYVRGCTFSPDGRIVASASDDRSVRLWDVETGKLQHVLDGFSDYVYSVVISRSGPDGRALLAAFESSEIRIWELYTGRLVRVVAGFAEAAETTEPVDKADLGEDEGGIEDMPEDVRAHQEKKDEDGQEDEKSDAIESSVDQTGQGFNVTSISITQDGKRIAAAMGSKVTIWDIPKVRMEPPRRGQEFNGTPWEDEENSDDVNRIIFSQEGSLLASSAGSQITIWNARTERIMRRLPESRPQSSKRTSEDKVSEEEKYVEATAEGSERLAGHSSGIDGLAFSPDSKFLASGSDDCTARIWDVEKGTTMAVLRYHKSYVNSVSFSCDGVYLATGSSDQTIGIWKRQGSGDWGCSLTMRQPDQVLRGHSSSVYSVAFAPQGRFLASCSSNDLRIWDPETWELDTDANATGNSTSEFVKAQLGQEAGSSSSALTGAGHTQDVSCVTISQDGRKVASASSDGVICLWDGMNGDRLCTMNDKHNGVVTALLFSQDGERLVSASSDWSAIVWEVDIKKAGLMHRLEGHTDWIRAVAIKPDKSLVATGSDDHTVRLWNISAVEGKAAAKEQEKELSVPCRVLEDPDGHTDWVYGVAFSPDGLHLASADDDGHVIIWNLEEQGHEAVPFKRLGNDSVRACIRGIVFLAGGERLLTVDRMGEIATWNPNDPKQERCVLEVEHQSDDAYFRWTSLQILRDHPDVLLNEFGAWPYELDVKALGKEVSSSLGCPRRDRPPRWWPLRIIDGGRWIMWHNRKEIFLPAEFRPAYSSPSWVCRVQGHSAVVGCDSGQILLFRFCDTEPPREAQNGEDE